MGRATYVSLLAVVLVVCALTWWRGVTTYGSIAHARSSIWPRRALVYLYVLFGLATVQTFLFTRWGWWYFGADSTLGVTVPTGGRHALPIDELGFFLTAPLALLAVWWWVGRNRMVAWRKMPELLAYVVAFGVAVLGVFFLTRTLQASEEGRWRDVVDYTLGGVITCMVSVVIMYFAEWLLVACVAAFNILYIPMDTWLTLGGATRFNPRYTSLDGYLGLPMPGANWAYQWWLFGLSLLLVYGVVRGQARRSLLRPGAPSVGGLRRRHNRPPWLRTGTRPPASRRDRWHI